jgi:hypothetical protein
MGLVITSASQKHSGGVNFASVGFFDSVNLEKSGAQVRNKSFYPSEVNVNMG